MPEGTVAQYQQLQKRAKYPANRQAFMNFSQVMLQRLGHAVTQGVAQGVTQAIAPIAEDVRQNKQGRGGGDQHPRGPLQDAE